MYADAVDKRPCCQSCLCLRWGAQEPDKTAVCVWVCALFFVFTNIKLREIKKKKVFHLQVLSTCSCFLLLTTPTFTPLNLIVLCQHCAHLFVFPTERPPKFLQHISAAVPPPVVTLPQVTQHVF